MTYKARKGDICAVARRHSSTYLGSGGGTREHWEWHIGRVTSVSREGVVKTAIAYTATGTRQEREYDRGRWWKALAISAPEYRAAAETLIGRVFASDGLLRAEIIAAAAEG